MQCVGTSTATLQSQARPGEWKLQRQNVEWRIRWLEHRLKELNYQHTRYATRLEGLETSELKSEPAKVHQCLYHAHAVQPASFSLTNRFSPTIKRLQALYDLLSHHGLLTTPSATGSHAHMWYHHAVPCLIQLKAVQPRTTFRS